MFNFLIKDEKEYKTFNGYLLIGGKRLTSEPLKTFLWLPKNNAETAHMFIYIDNEEQWKQIYIKELHTSNNINFEGQINYLNGNKQEEIYLKDIYIGNSKHSRIADNWFIGTIEIKFFKHLVQKYFFEAETTNEFIFNFTDSKYLHSHYIIRNDYTGEKKLERKQDIEINSLKHLGIKEITIDTSPECNLLKVVLLNPCKSFLQYYKTILPIVNYILATTSFCENSFIHYFKVFGEINNQKLEYYLGNQSYKNSIDNHFEMIQRQDYVSFLNKILEKSFKEINEIFPIIMRFININSHTNSVEHKITGLLYLLEKFIRLKGGNPDNKQTFLKDENIFCEDLINIRLIKNVRNCIAHGHEDLPFDDLLLVYDNLEILMRRIILKELGWSFQSSSVSTCFLERYFPNYKVKELRFKGKRECLERKKKK